MTKSSETLSHEVTSCKRSITTRGKGSQVEADEIDIKVHHRFTFKLGGMAVDMNSTLVVYSSAAEGKIVRIQDRPMDNIPDNSVLSVRIPRADSHPRTDQALALGIAEVQRGRSTDIRRHSRE